MAFQKESLSKITISFRNWLRNGVPEGKSLKSSLFKFETVCCGGSAKHLELNNVSVNGLDIQEENEQCNWQNDQRTVMV